MLGGPLDPCISCGTKDDLCLETIYAYYHPRDSYIGLLACVLISWGIGLYYSAAGDQNSFRAIAMFGSWAGILYYKYRSRRATYNLLFCESCRKRLLTRKYVRITIIVTVILVSVAGAIITSAVMGNDDYVYVPVVVGGVIGVVALCFKLLSKPRVTAIGKDVTTLSIPGIGHRQIKTLME
jgi:hypothetical protein